VLEPAGAARPVIFHAPAAARPVTFHAPAAARPYMCTSRMQILLKFASLIEENLLEIALLDMLEAGKPISECLNGDAPETATCIRWHAEVGELSACVSVMYGNARVVVSGSYYV